jgi:polyisoprenoid-binding protein YceI
MAAAILGMRAMRLAVLILSTALPVAAPAHVVRYQIDAQHSDVAAEVAFFGLARKTAHFPQLHGGLSLDPGHAQAVDLDVEIDARALVAPDPVTLARLKGPRFFDVEQYPTIRFIGHSLTLTGERSGTVTGDLMARGVSRPTTLAVQFDQPPGAAGAANGFVATTRIDRRDFGMTAYPFVVGRAVSIRIAARMLPATR